jgi:RHS repeat-associated protein
LPHDKKVLQRTTTDPLGNRTIETFDVFHRTASTEKRNPFGFITAQQDYAFDLTGLKILHRQKVIKNGAFSHDYDIRWEYDSMGREITVKESGGDDLAKATYSLYDCYGRLFELTKPDGVVLTHRYDALGRLETLTSSDKTIAYHYCYDLHHNPIRICDQITGSATTRQYDAFKHLVCESLANEQRLQYAYDPLGRLIGMTLPDHSGIAYTYAGTNLADVRRTDVAGVERYRHRYTAHDLAGRELTSQMVGSSGTRTLTWDSLGRNLSTHTTHWTETIPDGGYDAAGNLRCVTTRDPLGLATSQYAYDDLYQLTSEDGNNPHTYSYDSINNRIAKDAAQYSLNRLNQVTHDSCADYRYDLNGNLVTKELEGETTHYRYDALNRLVHVDLPQGTSYAYHYDSFGRRLSKSSSDDQSETYLYQGMREIGASINGDLVQLRVLGTGKGAELGAPVALELDGKVYTPVHDHRGNICCLLDSQNGQAAATYRYSAFGEAVTTTAIANPWGFASKRLDPETGFLYFGKRYYSPELGRWITPDPLGFTDGPNLYAYVHNSPLAAYAKWPGKKPWKLRLQPVVAIHPPLMPSLPVRPKGRVMFRAKMLCA